MLVRNRRKFSNPLRTRACSLSLSSFSLDHRRHHQAMLESQGFPAQAARAAAQTMNSAASVALPPMQPGATMQAMANFQQAAAAAMQSAMQGMHGVSALQLAVTPAPGQNAQQAYTGMFSTSSHGFLRTTGHVCTEALDQQ